MSVLFFFIFILAILIAESIFATRYRGKAKPHPKYNPQTYDMDVALIVLDKAIKFAKFHGRVVPLCLAR